MYAIRIFCVFLQCIYARELWERVLVWNGVFLSRFYHVNQFMLYGRLYINKNVYLILFRYTSTKKEGRCDGPFFITNRGSSSSGRAFGSQSKGSGFESHLLHKKRKSSSSFFFLCPPLLATLSLAAPLSCFLLVYYLLTTCFFLSSTASSTQNLGWFFPRQCSPWGPPTALLAIGWVCCASVSLVVALHRF